MTSKADSVLSSQGSYMLRMNITMDKQEHQLQMIPILTQLLTKCDAYPKILH